MSKVLNRINIPLLLKQKEALDLVINRTRNVSDAEKDHLQGVLNLLDAITDEITPVEPFANTWE